MTNDETWAVICVDVKGRTTMVSAALSREAAKRMQAQLPDSRLIPYADAATLKDAMINGPRRL